MNPMQLMTATGRERRVDGARQWRATGFAVLWAILGLALTYGFPVVAQEPDASAQTNNATANEVLSQLSDLVQAADPNQPQDMAPPEDMTPTNGLPQASGPAPGGAHTDTINRFDNSSRSDSSNRFQGSGQSQDHDRRSRRHSFRSRYNSSGSSGPAYNYSRGRDLSSTNFAAWTNNGVVTLDYSAFQIIVDENIFDPNRYPHAPGAPVVRPPLKSFDALTLTGTMSYFRGTFAVFDGTSSEYQKVLKLTDSIAGYKVTHIAPNSVTLVSGTNELKLNVGEQLRREENGPWLLTSQSASYAAALPATGTNVTATSATSSMDSASGSASDILKRMMQRREQD